MSEDSRKYRSAKWFGAGAKDGFNHRAWMKNQGTPHDAFDGRPVIGICNSWSELTPCNAHLRDVAERVKRGVWEADGVMDGVGVGVADGGGTIHSLPSASSPADARRRSSSALSS